MTRRFVLGMIQRHLATGGDGGQNGGSAEPMVTGC